jgi:hypothetical protein
LGGVHGDARQVSVSCVNFDARAGSLTAMLVQLFSDSARAL